MNLVCHGGCSRRRLLGIVFLALDLAALLVFGMLKFGALLLGHHAVGLGFGFLRVNFGLACIQASGFLSGQFAGCLALFDARGLAGLALVDVRRIVPLG